MPDELYNAVEEAEENLVSALDAGARERYVMHCIGELIDAKVQLALALQAVKGNG